MKKIIQRIRKEALQIKGGDFAQWYEGLSPVEMIAYKETLRK